jgi:methylated-DNA-[protein]-cysteine S-methyltransferase
MDHSSQPGRLVVFETSLGWMGALYRDQMLQRLTFGHPSAAAAEAAMIAEVGGLPVAAADDECVHEGLIASLREFAAGEPVDFSDVQVDDRTWTPFQRKVRAACRRISAGETRSYADLAAQVGSPQAARAVGRVMATNPVPIIIPCHRVVGSAGGLGGFSAPGGLTTKRRLLALESGEPSMDTRQAPRATRHGKRPAATSAA